MRQNDDAPQSGHAPPVKGGAALWLASFYMKSPWLILGLIASVMAFVLVRWDDYESALRVQETNNAYVHFDTISMEAKVSGYVRSVAFSDFQSVAQGDVLVTIADDDYRMAVLQAEAKRDHAAAALANLELEGALQEAKVDQAKIVVANTAAKLDMAQREHYRLSRLVKKGAVAEHDADAAETNLMAAEANHKESSMLVIVEERRLTLLNSDRALRQANLMAAEAALEAARIDLGHTSISAPVNSFAGSCKIREGELVRLGTPVVTLVPDAMPYIIANYKETQLTNIRPGQRVEIAVDTFPGEKLNGRVAAVSPATGSTYSLLPKDNSSGNFTKVVQRIPVRIDIEPGQMLSHRLRAGMSVNTAIDTDDPGEPPADPRRAGKIGPGPFGGGGNIARTPGADRG